MHNAANYETKTVNVEKGKEEIPIVDKPGSPSWKKAVKGKGNNFIAQNKADAERLINEAKPKLEQYPAYEKGIPSQNYQIHPIDNEYGMPHVKYFDYVPWHRKEGCQGHIFWEE